MSKTEVKEFIYSVLHSHLKTLCPDSTKWSNTLKLPNCLSVVIHFARSSLKWSILLHSPCQQSKYVQNC